MACARGGGGHFSVENSEREAPRLLSGGEDGALPSALFTKKSLQAMSDQV